jgi:uncharacterized protein (DUF305 family)
MHATHRFHLRALLVAGLAALAVTAGCGTDDSPTSAPTTPAGPSRVSPIPSNASYNEADVTFAQESVLHLNQAIEMARLAKTRAANPAVKKLAAKAEKDRQQVIDVINLWLKEAKQPIPDKPTSAGQAGGSGLANEAEMGTLAGVKGEPFDRLFLQMLAINVEAEINLLNGQQWSGRNAPMMSISHKISDDHNAELKEARRLLGR